MVVDGDRQSPLGFVLTDYVLVEEVVDLLRAGKVFDVKRRWNCEFFVDDLVTKIDAFVTDVDAGAGDQLLDLPLRLAAETAEQLLA